MNFTVKFKIEIEGVQHRLPEIDFFYEANDYNFLRDKILYDSTLNEYKITLSRIVGRGSLYSCPDIFISVITKQPVNLRIPIQIPIYFEPAKGSDQEYDLGTIRFKDFFDKSDPFHNPYKIIEVKADKSVHKRRKDEYELRRMNKLVKLELQDEN